MGARAWSPAVPADRSFRRASRPRSVRSTGVVTAPTAPQGATALGRPRGRSAAPALCSRARRMASPGRLAGEAAVVEAAPEGLVSHSGASTPASAATPTGLPAAAAVRLAAEATRAPPAGVAARRSGSSSSTPRSRRRAPWCVRAMEERAARVVRAPAEASAPAGARRPTIQRRAWPRAAVAAAVAATAVQAGMGAAARVGRCAESPKTGARSGRPRAARSPSALPASAAPRPATPGRRARGRADDVLTHC